ncbi:MAG TPA: DUF839 domain-containing protein [Campylobacterales bacterium]|nr:DUF839 domain-containing protein [Campylobacterales bacterium]
MKKHIALSLMTAVALTFVACDNDSFGEDCCADSSSNTTNETGNTSTETEETTSDKLSVSFAEIETPTGDAQNSLQVSNEVTVNGETQSIGYTKLMATTDVDNGETYGVLKDMNDDVLTMEDGSPYICNGTNDVEGSGLDYVSILQKNSKLYMVSQFECQVGGMYVNELEQDATTGALSAKSGTLQFISQKAEFGGYVHCAGMKTPWESHLGSEEYPPNARIMAEEANATSTGDGYFDAVAPYWGGDLTKMNPYYYGWTPEVTIDANGNAVYTKHYAMGRMSHELSYVMPDKKTVYMSDDGTNVGLFMFKADTAEDLSAGTLYAAKWTQTSAANGGSADISWIELGHASNAEIRAMIDPDGDVATNDGLTFNDIFDTAEGNSTTGTCPTGFTAVNGSGYFECLNVKNEKAAAFLETNRYAAYKGATTEFRKEEGITYDEANKKLYVAMSAIERGMEDNAKSGEANTKYDIGGNNDVNLDYNYCGAVYALDVDADMKATNMTAVVVGEMIEKDADGNSCHLDKISNPDNITFLPNSNILAIGEDTSKHKNNIVWAYDIETKELTRMLATPVGAETTSPFWYTDVNGFGYMTVVTQHPDAETADAGQSVAGVVGTFKNLK